MDKADYLKRNAQLERENAIMKQKLKRSIENRALLEEILETHSNALKARNTELVQSRELLRKSESKYRFLANHDSLTELPNRNFFNEELKNAISRTKVDGTKVALLFIDLDCFKYINDTYGHEAGDILLKQAANRLLSCIQRGSMLARIGGDEFTILIERLQNFRIVEELCKKIIKTLSKPFIIFEQACSIGASIGISVYPSDDTDIGRLLEKADSAMYIVKKSGANNYKFYQDIV